MKLVEKIYKFIIITIGRMAQMVRAPALQAGGQRFESSFAQIKGGNI